MSHFDYISSRALTKDDPTFAALIMAALRKADSSNFEILAEAFPEIHAEFHYRYWSGGGYMPGEDGYDPVTDDNLPVRSVNET